MYKVSSATETQLAKLKRMKFGHVSKQFNAAIARWELSLERSDAAEAPVD
jgi:hypothetical protein